MWRRESGEAEQTTTMVDNDGGGLVDASSTWSSVVSASRRAVLRTAESTDAVVATFNWQETTSLLMKELDNLGRHSPPPSASTSTAKMSTQHNNRATSHHHSLSPQPSRQKHSTTTAVVPSAAVVVNVASPSAFPLDGGGGRSSADDGVRGQPNSLPDGLRRNQSASSSHSVARAIIQAVKTRVRQGSVRSGSKKGFSTPSNGSRPKVAVNGHHQSAETTTAHLANNVAASSLPLDGDHDDPIPHNNNNNGTAIAVANSDSPVIHQHHHHQPSSSSSPSFPRQHQQAPSSSAPTAAPAAAGKARKNRFHLDLRAPSHLGLLRNRRAKSPPPKTPYPSVRTGSPEATTSGKQRVVCCEPPAPSAEEHHAEHGLIAFNSALLQVTPSSSAAVKQQPHHPHQQQYRSSPSTTSTAQYRRRHRMETTAEDDEPPPQRDEEPEEDAEEAEEHEQDDEAECSTDTVENDRRHPHHRHPAAGGSVTDDDSCCDGRLSPLHDVASLPRPVRLPACCTTGAPTSPSTESFLRSRNRFCTSYRLKVPVLKNPVDLCALPNRCLAIADYDNGFVVLNRHGDLVKHCVVLDDKNACGVVSCVLADELTLLVLAYKDGVWSIVCFSSSFDFTGEAVACPEDGAIETWALRKIAVVDGGGSVDASHRGTLLYLMATGETKSVIWSYEFASCVWKTLVTENARRGQYNDFAVRFDAATRDTHFLLCDWRKAQLSSVIVTDAEELAGVQSIKMRRVKGQEWIVQGPKLAVWDEQSDIVLLDGSGKVFAFDGQRFNFKRIVADVGRGEVGALAVRDGWCYALCRYRLCIEAILYREQPETTL